MVGTKIIFVVNSIELHININIYTLNDLNPNKDDLLLFYYKVLSFKTIIENPLNLLST